MNRKKLSTEFQKKWWLVVILAALLIGYLVWKSTSSHTEAVQSAPSVTEQTDAALDAPTPSDEMPNDAVLNEEAALNEDTALSERTNLSDAPNNPTLDPKTILNAPLPQTDSLAKEEIDRLEDERKRLAEQEKLAAEQLAMNKKLTDMKAEQIALLERQIAQLEAENTDKTTAE